MKRKDVLTPHHVVGKFQILERVKEILIPLPQISFSWRWATALIASSTVEYFNKHMFLKLFCIINLKFSIFPKGEKTSAMTSIRHVSFFQIGNVEDLTWGVYAHIAIFIESVLSFVANENVI